MPAAADDDAVLVFSSGTTGMPKAVRHTHGSHSRPRSRHWRAALGMTASDRCRSSRRRRTSSVCSTSPPCSTPVAGCGCTAASTSTPCCAHRNRPHHRRNGRGAHRAGDRRRIPTLESLRPVVAALHHVVRHPGDRQRRRDRHPRAPASAGSPPTVPASCRCWRATTLDGARLDTVGRAVPRRRAAGGVTGDRRTAARGRDR